MSQHDHRVDRPAALLAAAQETIHAARKAIENAGYDGSPEEVIAIALIACAGIGGAKSLIGS